MKGFDLTKLPNPITEGLYMKHYKNKSTCGSWTIRKSGLVIKVYHSDYNIDYERCNTPIKFLKWGIHLGSKNWITSGDLYALGKFSGYLVGSSPLSDVLKKVGWVCYTTLDNGMITQITGITEKDLNECW